MRVALLLVLCLAGCSTPTALEPPAAELKIGDAYSCVPVRAKGRVLRCTYPTRAVR